MFGVPARAFILFCLLAGAWLVGRSVGRLIGWLVVWFLTCFGQGVVSLSACIDSLFCLRAFEGPRNLIAGPANSFTVGSAQTSQVHCRSTAAWF